MGMIHDIDGYRRSGPKWAQRLESKIDHLLVLVQAGRTEEEKFMAQIDVLNQGVADLNAAVTAETTQVGSMNQLVAKLFAMVTSVVSTAPDLTSAIAALAAAKVSVTADTLAMATAYAANTPAMPPVA